MSAWERALGMTRSKSPLKPQRTRLAWGTLEIWRKEKPLRLREGVRGEIQDLLFRLLLLIGRGDRRSGVGGELLEVVLQQADFDAATADMLAVVIRSRGIAHADEIDAVDRDLMVEHEVANHRLGHFLRGGDGGLTLAGREALDFEDVTALTLDRGRHGVNGVLGVLAQDGLAGAEADFSLVRGLVLVNVADHGLDGLDAGGDL